MPALAPAIDLNEDCGINDRFISERGRSKTEWRPLSSVKCRCIIKNVLDLLYYDTKKNVIYADKKIKVYNKKKEYQQYIVDQLKMEGFFLMKDRYWINRFESRIDKFSVDELMKKNKESDAFMYRRIH